MNPLKRKLWLPEESGVKPADIVGFSGRSWLGTAINIATYGLPFYGLSHVGVMANTPDGRLLLFESTSLDDDTACEITGKPIAGTQAHSLDSALKRYRGAVWHYPLYRPLYPYEQERLTDFLMDTIGVPYDMMGAFRSGGVGLSWVESLLHESNLQSIFCSEWVAAAYAVTGLHATDNVSRWNPNRLCRHLRWHHLLCKPRRLK
jgi:hypothetical protein